MKILFSMAALFFLVMKTSFAASAVTNKDIAIPCYNSGFSFGLAAYNANQIDSACHASSCSLDDAEDSMDLGLECNHIYAQW